MDYDVNYRLYLVTDSSMCTNERFPYIIEEAIKGGVSVVQLREKTANTGMFYKQALIVKRITDSYQLPLIINDRIDIMLAIGAAGVHLGQSDMPLSVARTIVGKDKIIGISARTEKEAIEAEKRGANYLGVGAIFPTNTKKDAERVSFTELARIRNAVHIPIVGIGGIHKDTVMKLKNSGLDGIAIVSDIMNSKEPQKAAKELNKIFSSFFKVDRN